MPIATIVERAYGAADLDAILTRLRKEIAAADYPHPIEQDLGELAAQGHLHPMRALDPHVEATIAKLPEHLSGSGSRLRSQHARATGIVATFGRHRRTSAKRAADPKDRQGARKKEPQAD